MTSPLSPDTYPVRTPTGDPPRRSFRQTFALSLPTQGHAQALVLTPQTSLVAEFRSWTFDALAADPPLPARRTAQANGVRITLDRPLALDRVRFRSGLSGTVSIHRLDGSAVTEQPTTQGTIHSRQMQPADPFTDRQFILKRTAGDLHPNDITELWLTSYPTSPRLALLDPDTPSDSPIPIWQATGQLTDDADTAGEVNLVAADFKPLERLLAGLPQPLSNPIILQLIAASDAPCRFHLQAAEIDYRLSYQGFSPAALGPAKQVLRFQNTQAQPLSLTLPPQVHTVSLELSVGLRSPQPLASPSSTVEASIAQRQGVALASQQWLGQRFVPANPDRMSGVTLALLAMAPDSRVTVELHADHEHLPGKLLAQATATLPGAPYPQWLTTIFPSPAILYAQPYWLLLAASRPSLWLTQTDADDLLRLERASPQSSWSVHHRYSQTHALYHILSPAAPPPSPTANDADLAQPAVSLRLGEMPVDLTWNSSRDRISVHLGKELLSNQAASTITLTLATATSGIVTVYAPTVVYMP